MRHLDNFASLAACLCWSLTLPPHTPDDRSHRHSPGASSLCRQITLPPPSVNIITVAPYTLASPPSSSHPALSATLRRRATLTHEIPRHSQIRLPLPSRLFLHTRRHHRVPLGLRIAKPTRASYIQPHDFTVPQRPTGPVLHNGRKVRLTGFDTVPADLVILLGLILESRRDATQLT